VGNSCASTFASPTVTVNVCTPATITAQPTATPGAIRAGSSATLSIGASGTSLAVQWYTSAGVNVGSGLSIVVSPAATTTYHATVSNACTTTLTSATVTVSIDLPPTADFTISCISTTCSANASASSDDHGISSYAWLVNGVSNGVTTATWTSTLSAGKYKIQLFVYDALGQSAYTDKKITVTP
ncbi:MAG TPA: hypothetical protein VF713_00635, partial [Thermoanaerobaculia bacterium]